MKMLALLIVIVLCLQVIGCRSGEAPPSGNGDREGADSERNNGTASRPRNERSEPAGTKDDREGARQAEATSPQSTQVIAESSDGNRGDGDSAGDATPLKDEGSFLDLLGLIPLVKVNWDSVYINDYKRAREAHYIRAPAADASDEELKDYFWEIDGTGLAPGPWISGFTKETAIAQLQQAKHLGFSIGDVEQSIFVEKLPITLEAVTGRIDPEVTESSLRLCAGCPEPEIREHGGVKFYSWGEDVRPDLGKRLQPPAFDRLGRGGRITVLDSLALRTVETEGMEYLIDTYLDGHDSLAEDPNLALAAGVLDGLGVYSAILWANVEFLEAPSICEVLGNCDEEELEEMRSQLGLNSDDSGLLHEYILLGTGIGNDENGFYTALVFIHESEDAAEANVEVFEAMLAEGVSVESGRPWSEIFPEGEVRTDDRAMVARLRAESPWIWLSMVHARENLLWHK